jgi:hypothetical protein
VTCFCQQCNELSVSINSGNLSGLAGVGLSRRAQSRGSTIVVTLAAGLFQQICYIIRDNFCSLVSPLVGPN